MAEPSKLERAEYMAKLAEQAERYSEMVDYVKEMAKCGEPLNVEQRNLLSVAYKNVVGARRASWRALTNEATFELHKDDKGFNDLRKVYLTDTVEPELREICNDLLSLLDDHLVPGAKDADSQVFYMKMKGDYYRYLAEIAPDDESIKSSAQAAYEAAQKEAHAGLATTNPIRLGLALNYSVFNYEILEQREQACTLAKRAFDDAIADLDSLADDDYKDATLIMQLIRDNLTLWTQENQDGADQ